MSDENATFIPAPHGLYVRSDDHVDGELREGERVRVVALRVEGDELIPYVIGRDGRGIVSMRSWLEVIVGAPTLQLDWQD